MQSGFTPKDSAVFQLIDHYNTFTKAIDEGKEIRVIFCDLSKAIFKRLLNRDKVKVPSFFYNGNRKAQISHARIRLECSSLNADLFNNHISLTNKCSCGSVGTAEHFLLHCRKHTP